MVADENKRVTELNRGFFLEYSSRAHVVAIFRGAEQGLHRVFQIISFILCPLVSFFSAIAEAVRYSYDVLCKSLVFMHTALHSDYRSIAESLLEIPKTFYQRTKNEAKEQVWKPIDRTLRFLARYLWIRLQTLKIYCRGLAELSRRVFLLTSDYIPGGKWTVGIILGVISFLLVTRVLIYIGTVLQLVKFLFNIALLILDPILLTLKDIFAAVKYMLRFVLVSLRAIFSIFLSTFEKILYFISINVAAISTGVYKCWRSFLSSKPVQVLCTLLLSIVFNSLDIVLFSIVPFLSRIMLCAGTNVIQVFTFAYSKLAVVRTDNYTGEYSSVAAITTAVLILFASWLTFHLRNTFPPALYAMVNGYESAKCDNSASKNVSPEKTSPGTATQRNSSQVGRPIANGKAEEENTRVCIIRTSSLDPICSSFLLGNCQSGRSCDGHHCHARYHWQYRDTHGWKSFREELENHLIERLYCDPINEVVKTADVKMELSSYTSRHATRYAEEKPVQLDLENMTAKKSYRKWEIRRLSTESYVKGAGDVTTVTRWTWYYQDDEMVWRKYEADADPNENGPKQEEIEKAFLRRERYYSFSRNGSDYRLYFKLMCERCTSSRYCSKRSIRRRPGAISEEPAEQEAKNELSFWQKYSPQRLFAWR